MIKNITKNIIVVKDYKIAGSFPTKSLGLIRESNQIAMFFTTRFGIHTFFMNRKIDVVVLDDDNKVVKIKKNIQPNTIFFWNPRFCRIIELPEGSIDKSKTEIGDIFVFS